MQPARTHTLSNAINTWSHDYQHRCLKNLEPWANKYLHHQHTLSLGLRFTNLADRYVLWVVLGQPARSQICSFAISPFCEMQRCSCDVPLFLGYVLYIATVVVPGSIIANDGGIRKFNISRKLHSQPVPFFRNIASNEATLQCYLWVSKRFFP